MKTAIDSRNGKLKWAAALSLCVLCFSLCLSLLARPTLAAAGRDALHSVERIDASQWGPAISGSNKDSFGDTHENSTIVGGLFEGPGVIGWARYKLDGKYEGITGKFACADSSTSHVSMRLKLYADGKAEPIYTSGLIQRGTRPQDFPVIDLSGVKVLKMELVQTEAAEPGGTPAGFLLLINPLLTWETDPPAPDPDPLKFNYRAVTNYKNLYEVLDTQDKAKEPKEYIFSKTAPANGSALPAGALPVYVKADVFYIPLAADSDTYAAVKADGTLDLANAIWRGADKKIGTADDVTTTVKEENGSWFWKQADGTWKAVEPVVKFNYKAVLGYKNLYEVLDAQDKAKDPQQYIFSRTAPVNGAALPAGCVPALLKNNVFYVCFDAVSGIYLAVKTDGNTDLARALWWGADKLFGTADDFETSVKEEYGYYSWKQAGDVWKLIEGIINHENTTTAPAPSSNIAGQKITYVPVAGWYNLYKQYPTTDTSGTNFNYIFSFSGKPDTDHAPVFVQNGKYYFQVLKSDIYLALKNNGTFDIDDAVWAGPDKTFGTADDKVPVLREGSYFYEESAGVWKFITARFDYLDSRWTVPVTTTTAVTTTTTGAATTTTNGFFTMGSVSAMPKTGVPVNMGLLVCAALLFMGCAYCGYRLIRKERRA